MRDGAVEEEEDDMQEVSGSDPFKGGEITYFSGELWWIFVRSPLSLAVNLHNFTAFHRKITYEIWGEKTNYSPLILHIFAFFLDPGPKEIIDPHYGLNTMIWGYYGKDPQWEQTRTPPPPPQHTLSSTSSQVKVPQLPLIRPGFPSFEPPLKV